MRAEMRLRSEPYDRSIQIIFYNNPDEYPPIVNGVRLLARAGYRVKVLCREDGKQWAVSYPPEAQVQRIKASTNRSWPEYLGFVAQVLRKADNHASLYVGHDMHGLLPARLLASHYRRPLVYHCHDFNDRSETKFTPGGRLVKSFEQRFARTADLVIVPDRERSVIVADELCLSRPPLVVANAPIDCFAETGSALINALAARDKRFTRILFRQGRIGPGHAIEMTMRSIPYWRDRTWGFVVMGVSEPSYLDTLSRLARELDIEKQFVALPAVGYDQVAHFTPGAHVGHALYEPIHISHRTATTSSNKIMEYMAAGLPLLVSDRAGLRALVEKYGCGLPADESSPESIATAVNDLLGNPERAQRMGCAATRAFVEEFSYERQFAPVIEAFSRLSQQIEIRT
jgi:glycosyltransferase involved in cell wall biosynthesis